MFLTVLFLRKCVDGSCKTFCCFFQVRSRGVLGVPGSIVQG